MVEEWWITKSISGSWHIRLDWWSGRSRLDFRVRLWSDKADRELLIKCGEFDRIVLKSRSTREIRKPILSQKMIVDGWKGLGMNFDGYRDTSINISQILWMVTHIHRFVQYFQETPGSFCGYLSIFRVKLLVAGCWGFSWEISAKLSITARVYMSGWLRKHFDVSNSTGGFSRERRGDEERRD
jgi:hypothetical protein